MAMGENGRSLVMIVDDSATTVDILVESLADDYEVMAALDGATALEDIHAHLPDLILLDILMPGLDGYGVCRLLKDNPKTSGIPVIFVTALADDVDETRGFELGAVDYITKPISPPVVRARVKTHLALRQAQTTLEAQNAELLDSVRLREEVDRIMRHDLKGPLTSIISLSELMGNEPDLPEEHRQQLLAIEEAGWRMLHMINLSLDLFKMERGIYELRPEPVDLIRIAQKVANEIRGLTQARRLELFFARGGKPVQPGEKYLVLGDELLCYTMLANLLKNALEASPKGGTITIDFEDGPCPGLNIHNNGEVPVEVRERFFEKYATAGKSGGTGLGTYSAKMMAEIQGGCILMKTGTEEGTTISVRLPGPSDKQ